MCLGLKKRRTIHGKYIRFLETAQRQDLSLTTLGQSLLGRLRFRLSNFLFNNREK